MRTVALFLLSFLPCAATAATVPSDTQSSVSTDGRPIRVSLVNMSAQSRQIRLKSGVANLPVGTRVDVASRIGATLYIVSDTDPSIDERILVKSGDDAGLIHIQ
jgi:hypothetical protein